MESTPTDLLFVSAVISLEVLTLEKRYYTRKNFQNKTFKLMCITLRSDEKWQSYTPKCRPIFFISQKAVKPAFYNFPSALHF